MKGHNLFIVLSIIFSLGTCSGGPKNQTKEVTDSLVVPNETPIKETVTGPCPRPNKIKVFIENGPSMWGYAHMGNGFAEDIKRFVMNAQDVCDNVEIGLIGVEQKK